LAVEVAVELLLQEQIWVLVYLQSLLVVLVQQQVFQDHLQLMLEVAAVEI
jgi:hypothetical protein